MRQTARQAAVCGLGTSRRSSQAARGLPRGTGIGIPVRKTSRQDEVSLSLDVRSRRMQHSKLAALGSHRSKMAIKGIFRICRPRGKPERSPRRTGERADANRTSSGRLCGLNGSGVFFTQLIGGRLAFACGQTAGARLWMEIVNFGVDGGKRFAYNY